jgi:hypothetical protein
VNIPLIDFEEVYLMPTKEGFKLTEDESKGVGAPLHFRIEVNADDRDTWSVDKVWIVDRVEVSENRFEDRITPLEGKFGDEVANFFYRSDAFGDVIQDKVNHEIIPPVSELYRNHYEAGRTL